MLFVAAALSALDLIALFRRLFAYVKSIRSGDERFSIKSCWRTVVLDRDDHLAGSSAEYTGLVSDENEELDAAELKTREIEEGEDAGEVAPEFGFAVAWVDGGYDDGGVGEEGGEGVHEEYVED